MNGIPANWGTAVNVQAMVFGNMGEDSGTGVAFTRNPATGDDEFYGEFLVNAQGEDVVAGIRTPQKIGEMAGRWPAIAKQLGSVRGRLERHYKEMQDIEFTIEQGKLYVLQTRNGKRTGLAAVRIATEMAAEKLISKDDAILRVEPEALNHLLRPIFHADKKKAALKEGKLLARGLPAGPGAASGRLVFFAHEAEAWRARGETVVLARHETSPEDIRGMAAAEGFVTAFGGMTSHAALVARQMGKVAVVGCDALAFDYRARTMTVTTASGPRTLSEGDWLSIDGSAGEIIEGRLDTQPSEVVQVLVEKSRKPEDAPMYRQFAALLDWADKARRLGVRANADQPDQAATAVAFGAEGIGLCRTEHMFFGEGTHRPDARDDRRRDRGRARGPRSPSSCRSSAADFRGALRGDGRPARSRSGTLDPPLHEFLPHDEDGASPSWPSATAQAGREDPDAGRGAARVQPHARPPRLPARHLLSRRSPRCRRAPSSRRPATSPSRASRSSPR